MSSFVRTCRAPFLAVSVTGRAPKRPPRILGTLVRGTAQRLYRDGGLLRQACELEGPADGPGLVLLAADGAVAGMNPAAERWLEELGGRPDGSDLPIEIAALATRLRHLEDREAGLPRLRVRVRSGRWAALHASWLTSQAEETVAVIIEEAAPAEIAPMIMAAYGLTDRERTITRAGLPGPAHAPDRGPVAPDRRHRARPPEISVRQDRRAQPRCTDRRDPPARLPAPRARR